MILVWSNAHAAANSFSDSFFDFTYLLNQLHKQIPRLVQFLVAVSYVAGIALFTLGIMKFKSLGHHHYSGGGFVQPLVYIVIAAGLVFFPSTINMMTVTFMGPSGGDVAYSYSSQSVKDGYSNVLPAVIGILQLAGFIAFLKGWFMLTHAGNSQHRSRRDNSVMTGVLFVIGGILAVNIVSTSQIIKTAFHYVW